MARPKTFDRTQTLEKAVELFWSRGYEATSIHDLLAHLGIKRQSLYDTFGDKHRLFMEVLRYYETHQNAETIARLEGPGSGKAAIEAVYAHTVHTLARTVPPRGCLIVNTAIELAPHDPEIARWITESIERTQHAFYQALSRARDQGEIAPRQDLTTLARFLTTSLHGLHVTAKAVHDSRQLQEIAQVALSVLA